MSLIDPDKWIAENINSDNHRRISWGYQGLANFKEFSNKCNRKIMVYLFGEENGNRLWEHFVVNCERDTFKFYEEYLTNHEKNLFMINLYFGDVYAYYY